jgi:hypothetical protein
MKTKLNSFNTGQATPPQPNVPATDPNGSASNFQPMTDPYEEADKHRRDEQQDHSRRP